MQNIVKNPSTKVYIFIEMKNPFRHIAFALILFTVSTPDVDCAAAPASPREFFLYQPDGTAIAARRRGDEFTKILTTADGCTIRMGEDKWYYYAWYEDDGSVTLSEYRAGKDVPQEIMARSRNIPYGALASAAAARRAGLQRGADADDRILLRIRAARNPGTRAEDGVVERHGIVILAQFPDLQFRSGHTRESFERLLSEPGYSYNGATGSASDYFNDQFKGFYTFSFDVSDIVTVDHEYAYYGGNDDSGHDKNPGELIADACRKADSQIDFSKYDDDGDGKVDNVFVFFAGEDEAEAASDDHIWSHAWYLSAAGETLHLDGKTIDRYACAAELHRSADGRTDLTGIGTFCHEFCHTLGISDYYDTDYENSDGKSTALWQHTSLMDGGNYNNENRTPPNLNAPEREETGIFEATALSAGTCTLEPIDANGVYYRADTENEGEYYLFECRTEKGWDSYIGGSGLLVYHIDKSSNEAGYSSGYRQNLTARQRWQYNEVNCYPAHQCADLIEAYPGAANTLQPGETIQTSMVRQVFFPYVTTSASYDAFTPDSTPAFVSWSGAKVPFAITDIEKSGDNIVMHVYDYEGPLEPVSVSCEVFQDAVILTWSASAPDYDGSSTVSWRESAGGERMEESVNPYEPGQYSCTIEGLTPRTPYRVEISFEGSGEKAECNFTTKSPRSRNYPYIYLFNIRKNADGSYPAGSRFPLRLYNAYDADGIDWYLNGMKIETDGSGYYTPESSGEMKAEITYPDGTKSIVTKNIVIK